MPLPYLWLFAFMIPFSCCMSLLTQADVGGEREP